MSRRCVVCGKEATGNATDSAYHYPKNKKEARIWQKSMGAFDTPVECIRKTCCVCIEHIPEFVERTQQQAALIKKNCEKNVQKPVPQPLPCSMCRPSLNVLLLSGATLPAYCGNAKETSSEVNKDEKDDDFDEEICVRESNYKDGGISFPDIDETEVTVLRTPMDDEHELKSLETNNIECGDVGNMRNCTDVLLLGRTQNHPTDKCPCKCETCSNTNVTPNDPGFCLKPEIPGCTEFDCKLRQELSAIIGQQQERICQLENMLRRQNGWYITLQQKMDELYSEFSNMAQAEDVDSNVKSCQDTTPQEQSRNPSVQWEDERDMNTELVNSEQMDPISNDSRVTAGGSVQWYAQRSPVHGQSEQTITSCRPKRSKKKAMQSESSK